MLPSSAISARILHHLGVVGALGSTLGLVGAATVVAACEAQSPSPASPSGTTAPSKGGTTTAPTTITVDVAPASSSAAPLVVVPTPSASASPVPPPQPGGQGAVCEMDVECAAPLRCRIEPGASKGRCRMGTIQIMEGRPLVVAGEPAVADVRESGARRRPGEVSDASKERWAEHLRHAAVEEHASIAAFARTICELMAIGAPSWLIAKTQEALADEIRHAEETFAWLAACGRDLEPGPLSAAVAPLRSGASLSREFLCDVFRGGCIGESLAATRAAERASEAAQREPALAAFFARIAEDDARHAALAFETVRWLVAREPTLSDVLGAEMAAFDAVSTAADRVLLVPLFGAAFGEVVGSHRARDQV